MNSFQHPTDAWYQIEVKGEHLNRAAGVVQVIDGEAVTSIVNRFNAEAVKPNFAGMLIDHEHFKHDQDKETRAFGWLTQLQSRADGLYGQIRWTATGQAAVDGGDYRFFSTEYDPKDCAECATPECCRLVAGRGKENSRSGNLPTASVNANRSSITNQEPEKLTKTPLRLRPLRLDGLSLTNSPNNRGQKPITNRATPGVGTACPHPIHPERTEPASRASLSQIFRPDANAPAADIATKTKIQTMKLIANRLKLSAEAGEDSIVAELDKLFNRVTELETQNTELSRVRVEAALEKYKNRFKPAKRDAWKTRLTKDYADAIDALESLPDTAPVKPGLLHNRAQTLAPETDFTDQSDERAQVDKIKNRADELQSQNRRRSFTECWNQASAESARKPLTLAARPS